MPPVNVAFPSAVQTADVQGHLDDLDFCSLGNGTFGQNIKIHLHTLRDHAAELPQLQADGLDPHGMLLLGGLQGNIQNALRDGQLMHDKMPPGLGRFKSNFLLYHCV